jgi:hypothetical protein
MPLTLTAYRCPKGCPTTVHAPTGSVVTHRCPATPVPHRTIELVEEPPA